MVFPLLETLGIGCTVDFDVGCNVGGVVGSGVAMIGVSTGLLSVEEDASLQLKFGKQKFPEGHGPSDALLQVCAVEQDVSSSAKLVAQ